MNSFEVCEPCPSYSSFCLNSSFGADSHPNKFDLGAGVYKNDTLEPYILSSVKRAEVLLIERENSKDYLPIDGLPEYISMTGNLVFGKEDERIYGAQAVGGTVSLRIGAAFLKELGLLKVYLSRPTWVNHDRIFKQAGLEVK